MRKNKRYYLVNYTYCAGRLSATKKYKTWEEMQELVELIRMENEAETYLTVTKWEERLFGSDKKIRTILTWSSEE